MTPRLYLIHGTDEYAGAEFVDELPRDYDERGR